MAFERNNPLPPNVKASEPTHRPARMRLQDGFWRGNDWIQYEGRWTVTYWNAQATGLLALPIVATWE